MTGVSLHHCISHEARGRLSAFLSECWAARDAVGLQTEYSKESALPAAGDGAEGLAITDAADTATTKAPARRFGRSVCRRVAGLRGLGDSEVVVC